MAENCTCIVPEDTTIAGYIRIRKSELKIAAVNVLVGRHATGKSILMASLYDSLLQEEEEKHHRYVNLTQPMKCSSCTYARYGIWLPAERVILPLSEVCEEREGVERELEERETALTPLAEKLLHLSLKNLCQWQRSLAAMHERIFSPELHGMAYYYIMEAKKRAIRVIHDVSSDEDAQRLLSLELPYTIILERGRDVPGEPPYRFMLRDMRSGRIIRLEEASHAASAAVVLSALSLAAAHAFVDRTVLAVEEPEEEAHPYAQFILGYVLSYTVLKTWLDPGSHGIILLATTHSEYVLSGMLKAAYDLLTAGNTARPISPDILRPRIYVVDYDGTPGDREIEVAVREWKPGDVIPGFFGRSLPLTISPRKLRELYGKASEAGSIVLEDKA